MRICLCVYMCVRGLTGGVGLARTMCTKGVFFYLSFRRPFSGRSCELTGSSEARFQMVSLLELAQVTEEGVRFLSPHDGTPM